MFDNWKAGRHRIANLTRGTPVTVLSSVNEVDKPDVIQVTAAVPDLGLKADDQILRYTERAEGNADFWANGKWFKDADLSFVQEPDGSGCQSACKARVTQSGQQHRWFHIRLPDGRTGWTEASSSLSSRF